MCSTSWRCFFKQRKISKTGMILGNRNSVESGEYQLVIGIIADSARMFKRYLESFLRFFSGSLSPRRRHPAFQ
jgi:hypothetical protein